MFALMSFAVANGGCDSESTNDSESANEVSSLRELGIDDGASQGQKTSALVTGKEEVVMKLATGAQVKVPQGAVKSQVNLGLRRPDDKQALALVKSVPAKDKLASAPYVVTPHGTQFEKEVEITLPVSKERDSQRLKVLWLSDEKDTKWKEQGKPKVVANGKATFSVKHFSVLLLVEGELNGGGARDGGDGDSLGQDSGIADGGGEESDGGGMHDASTGLACGPDAWDHDADPSTLCVPHTECPSGTSVPGTATSDAVCTLGSPVRALAAGDFHACALHEDGTITCWGDNRYNQLGGESVGALSATPIAVSGLEGAIAITAGARHSCALRTAGTVVCWGESAYDQLGGESEGSSSATPVAVTGLAQVTAIVAGGSHTCALLEGGTVACWGYNEFGQLGGASEGFTSLTPIEVDGLSDATALAADGGHTCALRAGGTVVCWGNNEHNQLGGPTEDYTSVTPVAVSGFSDATAIATGERHTCALRADGTIACWGYNSHGQLGQLAVGDSSFTPIAVSGLSGATAISAHFWHTCVLIDGGSVICWGYNENGHLGEGSEETAPLIAVNGLTDVTALSAGENFTCALRAGGSVACWGRNHYSQLGPYHSWQ